MRSHAPVEACLHFDLGLNQNGLHACGPSLTSAGIGKSSPESSGVGGGVSSTISPPGTRQGFKALNEI